MRKSVHLCANFAQKRRKTLMRCKSKSYAYFGVLALVCQIQFGVDGSKAVSDFRCIC